MRQNPAKLENRPWRREIKERTAPSTAQTATCPQTTSKLIRDYNDGENEQVNTCSLWRHINAICDSEYASPLLCKANK